MNEPQHIDPELERKLVEAAAIAESLGDNCAAGIIFTLLAAGLAGKTRALAVLCRSFTLALAAESGEELGDIAERN